MTLPVHPFHGLHLRVIQEFRRKTGSHPAVFLDLEDPHGRCIRIPVGWTDRGALFNPPEIIGRVVRVDAHLLAALAAVVEEEIVQISGASVGSDAASVSSTSGESGDDATISAT